ncbi:hypothetical protein CHH90_21735 [Bacillus licheniformis]|uniref:Uncharacterized protein n=1 Tax=Bacillus licheniformis (strain ATCC 14580 / DSM 13 / JCM 2505 / CCUG 7422 / NBRC 12200 / NCIMB 9375 / NCTC 10341 / NRRL NRS-1264 / Gibson 46) TaxID=279010 RepID=Q65EV3_BACLD|nr:putative phage protein [Bacillus licheniformis DSM 13 = ATCC 14580]MBY8347985.1 hypothetical protein [Bacillus sp. PCH94]PAE60360.1 hypothetical protein CHH90_21735 [Bacillus licheniformis]ABP97410.1 hypothetical protein BL07061 [Bacillus licheniformis DSM 13 = ATCC 14580]PAV37375.1 hypothetical protein CJD29_02365 [Bacillus licheniformis]
MKNQPIVKKIVAINDKVNSAVRFNFILSLILISIITTNSQYILRNIPSMSKLSCEKSPHCFIMNIYILKQMRGIFYIVLLEQLAQYFAGCFSCSSAGHSFP